MLQVGADGCQCFPIIREQKMEGMMPQFLLVHDVLEYPETQEEWITMWRELRARSSGEAQWLSSFYEPASRKMYCQWEASDSETIMACLTNDVMEKAPVTDTSEIVIFDVAWLDDDA